MEKTHAQEIESKKLMIEENLLLMKKLRKDFVVGIVPFSVKWIQTITRQYVERNPEKSIKLGTEGLAIVKKKVKSLCDEVESICTRIFASDEYWPESRDLLTQNQLGLRIVLGKLGIILEEFGFIKSKAQTETDKESWDQYDGSGNRREFDGTDIYPHSVELPPELKNLIEEYRSTIQKQFILSSDIKKLEFEMLQKQATKLWDSI